MHSKRIRRFHEILISELLNEKWDLFFGISLMALSKLTVLAERRLMDHDINDATRITNIENCKRLSFVKRQLIILNVSFKTFQILVAFIVLRIKYYSKNTEKRNRVLASDNLFLGDFARSFEGFLGLTKSIGKTGFISFLQPIDLKSKIRHESDNLIITTGVKVTFSTALKIFGFLFVKVPAVLKKISFLSSFTTKELSFFFFHFVRNLLYVQYANEIADKINPAAIVLCRDDAYYAIFIDAFNKKNISTVHVIHGTSINDEMTTTPKLAKYISCGGGREIELFSKEVDKRFLLDIGAPLQVVYKNNLITENKKNYELLIIGSFELWIIYDYFLKVFAEARAIFKTKKTLLRHHPNIPPNKKRFLEQSIGQCTISLGRTLTEDIADAEIIICCSTDSLQSCLMNYKKVIFFPPSDGDTFYYAGSFSNVLPNLIVAGTGSEIINGIEYFEKTEFTFNTDEYNEKLLYLFGEMDIKEITSNFENAFKKVRQDYSH